MPSGRADFGRLCRIRCGQAYRRASLKRYIIWPKLAVQSIKSGEVIRFIFTNWPGPDIPVWIYVPIGVDVTKAPIIFMLHGAKRDPHRYLREWVEPAQQYGLVVAAPEFSRQKAKGRRKRFHASVIGII